jgi:hypothetical protein
MAREMSPRNPRTDARSLLTSRVYPFCPMGSRFSLQSQNRMTAADSADGESPQVAKHREIGAAGDFRQRSRLSAKMSRPYVRHPAEIRDLPKLFAEHLVLHVAKQPLPIHRPAKTMVHPFTGRRINFYAGFSHLPSATPPAAPIFQKTCLSLKIPPCLSLKDTEDLAPNL